MTWLKSATGASGGIGALIAAAFLLSAFTVAGCGKDEPKKTPPKAPAAPVPPADDGGEGKTTAGPETPDKPPVKTPPKTPAKTIKIPTERTFGMAEGGAEFLDPNLTSESAGSRIITQLFEQLVVMAPGNPKPVPAAAKSWKTSEDGKTWTFTLREESKWSDGTPITSADWLYSFERALNPKSQSRNAQQYWIINGAQAYNKGDSTDFSTVAIKTPSKYELELTISFAAPYFLELLTYAAFSPVPKHVIDKHEKQWTRAENMVSNGAFKMTMWKLGDRIEAVKNTHYWDQANVWLNKIVFYETNSEEAADDWYEMGRANWTPGLVPVQTGKKRLEEGREDLHIDPILCTYYYVFNTTKPPFDDARVRRAFNIAFDKGALVRQVLGLGQTAATHLVPPHFKKTRGYGEVRGEAFNPEVARTLLAEAGYNAANPFPKVALIYNTYEAHRNIAQFYQRSIKQNLGVDIEINNMEWKSLLQTVHAGDFQIARTSWCADFPDPENFLQVFHSEGENNYA
ncbi:MAG: oligopeptide transport system substrate-binding protein, partial [Myxococcota bacterium]